jgi:hypothetical protein
MNKLLSVIVAALFAVSASAFVAPDAGAQPKDEPKKTQKKGEGKKKSEGKKGEPKKKTMKKGEGKKKDETKK